MRTGLNTAELMQALTDPAAYPHPVDEVKVVQTHISTVFLTGNSVYKIKKPVEFGFLDYSTLEKRRRFCHEEIRLNRPLAGPIYRGVLPVVRRGGVVRMGGTGEVVDYAVHMEQLPGDCRLLDRVRKGETGRDEIARVAERIADFHARAPRGEEISKKGGFETVSRNVRENLEQAASLLETVLSRPVFDRLWSLIDANLMNHRELIESRAARHVPCETHGDLRLEHVYVLPERESLGGLAVIDAIEFNERFRFADPVSDIAFLVMDLIREGRQDMAAEVSRAYFGRREDEEGGRLLDFYAAYRAAARGKVLGMKSQDEEVGRKERERVVIRARAFWLLSLDLLEGPPGRPCLVLMAGLPGTGKSTLAAALAEEAGFTVIRSDLVRKELAGGGSAVRTEHRYGQGIYSEEWNRRTYEECLLRAERLLFDGRRPLVDATFSREADRAAFLQAANRWGVRSCILHCTLPSRESIARLGRRQNDPSDATSDIFKKAAEAWEPFGEGTRAKVAEIGTAGPIDGVVSKAIEELQKLGLAGAVAIPGTVPAHENPSVGGSAL